MRDRALLYARAKAMRREATPAERVLWRILRSRRLAGFKFRRQVPLGPYIADFACFDPKVVIECDGAQHADSAYDTARDAWLSAQGFRVIRFWNRHVREEPDGVVDALLAQLSRRSCDPSPSH